MLWVMNNVCLVEEPRKLVDLIGVDAGAKLRGVMNNVILTERARGLLLVLVDAMKAGELEAPLAYSEVAERLGYPNPRRFAGRKVWRALNELNDWTLAHADVPKVTGLVVDMRTGRPNVRYARSHGVPGDQAEVWWREQIRTAVAFDWDGVLGERSIVSPSPSMTEEEEEGPAMKQVIRRVRDGRVTREVKATHNHTCQICGKRFEVMPGVAYSEGHHLKPLGRPHLGPDVPANVVCVCPECHVKLDCLAIQIDVSSLRKRDGHSMGAVYIDYHNKLWRQRC
jgi:hypothetical protein